MSPVSRAQTNGDPERQRAGRDSGNYRSGAARSAGYHGGARPRGGGPL